MRIKDGFILREVMGQAVVVPTGSATEIFSGMIKLNDTGKCIWQGLLEGENETQLVERIVAEFDVSQSKAEEGVKNFLAKMAEKGFIEE